MKIFITSVDTELGYHLTQHLRQDHLLLEGFSLISGTRSHSKNPFPLHQSLHQTFDFTRQRDLAVRNALQSDALIVDLRYNPAPQIQFILKVLKHYPSKKPIKLIGISNYVTWSNSKTIEFTETPYDKQALLEYTINKNHWQPSQLNKAHYPLRTPHPIYAYNHLLEQQILQMKNANKMVEPVILCGGLLYGKSGLDLKAHVQNAIKAKDDWVLELRSKNMIGDENMLPVLHVDRLMQEVDNIVYGNNQNQGKIQEYKVLCQDNPKSIVQIVQGLNKLCGNTKQINSPKNNALNQEKQAFDTLKLPSSNEQPSSSTHLTNEFSSRALTPNRNSSSQTPLITQILTRVFIPELTFAKDKFKFSFLVNINFMSSEENQEIEQNRIGKAEQYDDTYVQNTLGDNPDDSMEKVKENDSSPDKAWLKTIIQQFNDYFDCDFKRFLLSEQLMKQQLNQDLNGTLLGRYFVIDRKVLTEELSILVEKGVIAQQRLATPEDENKKTNNSKNMQNRQLIVKEPYEAVFSELIEHVLTKYKLCHFVICIKAELISKLLSLLIQPNLAGLQDMKFISLTRKESSPNTSPLHPDHQNITKCIQLFSDQFYHVYDIENPQTQANLYTQPIKLDQEETKKLIEKSRKNLQQKNDPADQPEQLKVNLLHQYLLDNLIVYLAQAKHNLKAKGKLTIGQNFEGKQNLKLFIEELKQIRTREMKMVCDDEQ